jgi:hypothetical protein
MEKQVRINVLPSKMFQRDGNNPMDVRSILQLTAGEAEEGGPFEVETLRGMDMVFLSAHVKDGDTHKYDPANPFGGVFLCAHVQAGDVGSCYAPVDLKSAPPPQGCWEDFCGTGWGSASAGFG